MFNAMPAIRSAGAGSAPVLTVTTGLISHVMADAGITKDGGDLIETWADQSGNGNDWGQSDSAKRPLWVDSVQNGLPVVRFDAVNDFMDQSPFISGTSDGEIFVVVLDKSPSVTTFNGIYHFVPGGNADIWHWTDGNHYEGFGRNTRTIVANSGYSIGDGFGIHNVSAAHGGNQVIRWNGSVKNTQGSITAGWNTTSFKLGNSTAFPVDIDIAEVVIYNVELSSEDRTSVEGYLNAKWDLY